MKQPHNPNEPLDAEGVERIIDQAKAEGWTALGFTSSNWPDEPELPSSGRRTFFTKAWSPHLTQRVAGIATLRYLALRFMDIGEQGVRALAEGGRELVHLDLHGNSIGPTGAEHLAGALAHRSGLAHLDLGHNLIGPTGAEHLARVLTRHAGLAHLNLCSNWIGPTGAEHLAQALTQHSGLAHLNLSSNRVGPSGVEHLAGALAQHSGLTHLELGVNNIGSVEHLALALAHHSGLAHLDLSGNSIGPTDAQHLARALTHYSGLAHLDLSGNSIGPTGAQHLARALTHHSGLAHLDLGYNEIGPTGAEHLAQALAKHSGLAHLDLRHNKIGHSGAKHLVRALAGHSGVVFLDLGYNEIGRAAAGDIAEALGGLKSLTVLDLHGNRFGIDDTELPPSQPAVVIDRLRALSGGTARPWREVKIALLGDGEVGKSMLRWRVRPLPGEAPPRDEDRTRAWERRVVRFPIPPGGSAGPGAAAADDEVVAHLFDFGGQVFLWGSHRLFLGVRRSLYTVVARADKPLDHDGNRVLHWVRMVARMRDEAAHAMADDEFERGLESGEPPARDRGEFVRRRAEELAGTLPWPPVVVVLTHARTSPRKEFQSELERLRGELAQFAREFGEIPVLVTDLGERDAGAQRDARSVIAQWEELLVTSQAVKDVWTSTGTPAFFALRGALSRRFPEPEDPRQPDGEPWISLEDYLNEARTAGVSDELAHGYLPEFRDVGVVHWVGDASDHLVDRGNEVRELVFNPRRTARPVCEVLWTERGQACVGVVPRTELLRELRAHAGDGGPAPRKFESRLLDLMIASRLVFKVDLAESTEPLFVVPDHLPVDGRARGLDTFAMRWKPEFLPDAAMPRIIGRLWRFRDGEQQNRNRLRMQLAPHGASEASASCELVQHAGWLIVQRVQGRAAADLVRLLEHVRHAVEVEFPTAPAEQGGEWVTEPRPSAAPVPAAPRTPEEPDQGVSVWTWERGSWCIRYCAAAAGGKPAIKESGTFNRHIGFERIARILAAQDPRTGIARVPILDLSAQFRGGSEEDGDGLGRGAKSSKGIPSWSRDTYARLRKSQRELLEMTSNDPLARAEANEELEKAAAEIKSLQEKFPGLGDPGVIEDLVRQPRDAYWRSIRRMFVKYKDAHPTLSEMPELCRHLSGALRRDGDHVVYNGCQIRWETPTFPKA